MAVLASKGWKSQNKAQWGVLVLAPCHAHLTEGLGAGFATDVQGSRFIPQAIIGTLEAS